MEQSAEAIERGKKACGEIVRWDTCCVSDGKEVVLRGTESIGGKEAEGLSRFVVQRETFPIS